MVNVILHGYMGQMGRTLIGLFENSNDFEIVAGADVQPPLRALKFPTFLDISDCDMPADVIVDFSTAAAVPKLLDYAAKRGLPVIVCTTGLSGDTLRKIKEASKKAAVFHSANMSLGVNLMARLVSQMAPILYAAGFDIEIIEMHHNQKIDAPSGTAKLLADTAAAALKTPLTPVYDRSAKRERRSPSEIGVHSVRGGSIVGEHTVLFAGHHETLSLTHSASSKEVFARGAAAAAKFMKGKPPGLYDMDSLIGNYYSGTSI